MYERIKNWDGIGKSHELVLLVVDECTIQVEYLGGTRIPRWACLMRGILAA